MHFLRALIIIAAVVKSGPGLFATGLAVGQHSSILYRYNKYLLSIMSTLILELLVSPVHLYRAINKTRGEEREKERGREKKREKTVASILGIRVEINTAHYLSRIKCPSAPGYLVLINPVRCVFAEARLITRRERGECCGLSRRS